MIHFDPEWRRRSPRTHYVYDGATMALAWAELPDPMDPTTLEQRARALATWRWRGAAQVLDNAARLKRYAAERARFGYAQTAPSLVALRAALTDPRERAHFDRIQRGEY